MSAAASVPTQVQNTWLARKMEPSSAVCSSPQGAASNAASAAVSGAPPLMRLETFPAQKSIHRSRGRAGTTQVRAVTDVLDDIERAARQDAAHVLTYSLRRNQVVVALNDQRGHLQPGKLGAQIGEEGRARELLGDLRIRSTEAI